MARFEVPGSNAADLRLYTGSLSEYYERRLRERDLPESLLDREVQALRWGVDPAAPAWLGNQEPLVPGQRYSLAELGLGLLLEVDVAFEQPEYAPRVWPPQGRSGRLAVFCPGWRVGESSVSLDACGVAGHVAVGISDVGFLAESCFTLELTDSASEPCLAPLAIGDSWLPATRLAVEESVARASLECAVTEQPLADGCARAGDSYLALRKPRESLWVVEIAGNTLGPETGDFLVISGLSPDTSYAYSLVSLDPAGNTLRDEGEVRTLAPRAQVVLNEVLANPNGPEPAQEWIELFNAGSRVASLDGYTLEDGAGRTELPPATVSPGAYALLVTPEYDRAYPFDLSPSKEVQLIVVEQLGKSGLSNSGEPLILRDPDGDLVSAIPPLKHDKPGYSVARRTPELSDVLISFQTHGAPGASPGEANRFDAAATD
ncbi:MAG: lamin tail domain-containing protein [Polyangiaceae bacterium]|nr:lamin tail domain-containing protein [Myxococcales bacterium]MCB9588668.1 lamin tail domain-containing protein [Polyangiaceae bacterium]MCB9605226.1 lamin tail domain-containing protein [Polyangiaceae bacterium]